MKLPLLHSLFSKKTKKLTVPDTILIKKLKNLSSQSNLLIYKDVTIYHHTNSYSIPLLVIDDLRGIYVFETKEWTYDELKNAQVQKAKKQETSANTLAFDNTHAIIRQKFNEITHNDGVPIFNYLLMENLNADEYEHLNDSFKELLPKEKIIFSDSLQADILQKLQDASPENHTLPSREKIVTTLFMQYAILDVHQTHIATQEQMLFIDKELALHEYLEGVSGSGKSNLLLLKAIKETFHNPQKKTVIVKPTHLACDILKKKLLEIVEYAIIEINLSSIEIITPLELLNRHQAKLKREPLRTVEVDDKLLHKKFFAADFIMCDDAHLLPLEFLEYLKQLQQKRELLLVNAPKEQATLSLTKNFRMQEKSIEFCKTNPHAKAMHLIAAKIKNEQESVMLVSNSLTREKLKDDLASFIEKEPQTIESNRPLLEQNFSQLLFCDYGDINEIQSDHIILMDLCFSSKNEIEYAFNLSTKSATVLYEEECQEIKNLRKQYEKQSSQERSGVESTTLA